ncbi:hypothetical protein LINPERPRIM_LOCUS14936 [Linum perenne]
MDGGGEGWQLMNFATGRLQNDTAIINRMMLRFRPIAPKPPSGLDSSAGSRGSRLLPKGGRTKRKYVRVRATASRKSKNNNDNNRLQLLPETVEQISPRSDDELLGLTLTYRENNNGEKSRVLVVGREEVETWVTAEGVTDACMDMAEQLGLLGIRKKDLEGDTCPAFVSDSEGKVQWVNEAYREMVTSEKGKGCSGAGKVRVKLVVEEKLKPYMERYKAFSCWVGVRFGENSNRNSSNSNGLRVPCDVWKVEEGFAWRLDIKVALKLGL